MHSYHTPRSFLNDLSRLAKQEKHYSEHGHSYFLEQIAKYSGLRPWSTLRDTIENSGEQTFLHRVDEALVARVSRGLEKAVPNAVTNYAVSDARRLLDAFDLTQRNHRFTGAENLRDFLSEHFDGIYSARVLEHVHNTLAPDAPDGTYLYQESPILDFQGP